MNVEKVWYLWKANRHGTSQGVKNEWFLLFPWEIYKINYMHLFGKIY